jgi:CRP-like cAMP-binding protein
MSTDIERFSTVPLFDLLSQEEIVGLLSISKTLPIRRGQVLIEEGTPGDGLYIIGKGAFDVVKEESGTRVELARLEELSFFGEMSLVSSKSCSATVVCVEPGRVTHFPVDPFRARLEANDLAAYKMVLSMCGILADRLARVDARVRD